MYKDIGIVSTITKHIWCMVDDEVIHKIIVNDVLRVHLILCTKLMQSMRRHMFMIVIIKIIMLTW